MTTLTTWLYEAVVIFGPGVLLVFGPLLLWAAILWLGRLPRRMRARRIERLVTPATRARYSREGEL